MPEIAREGQLEQLARHPEARRFAADVKELYGWEGAFVTPLGRLRPLLPRSGRQQPWAVTQTLQKLCSRAISTHEPEQLALPGGGALIAIPLFHPEVDYGHLLFHVSDEATSDATAAALRLVNLAAQSFTRRLAVLVEADEAHWPASLRSALRWIRTHQAEPVTLEQAAAAAGISALHLSKLCRRHLGITFTEYLQRTRLREARLRLETSEESIAVIADATGFGSLSQFNRVFKQYVGKPPRIYRQEHHAPVPQVHRSRRPAARRRPASRQRRMLA